MGVPGAKPHPSGETGPPDTPPEPTPFERRISRVQSPLAAGTPVEDPAGVDGRGVVACFFVDREGNADKRRRWPEAVQPSSLFLSDLFGLARHHLPGGIGRPGRLSRPKPFRWGVWVLFLAARAPIE